MCQAVLMRDVILFHVHLQDSSDLFVYQVHQLLPIRILIMSDLTGLPDGERQNLVSKTYHANSSKQIPTQSRVDSSVAKNRLNSFIQNPSFFTHT